MSDEKEAEIIIKDCEFIGTQSFLVDNAVADNVVFADCVISDAVEDGFDNRTAAGGV